MAYLGKILNKSPVKTHMPQKTSHSLNRCRGWQICNQVNFGLINFYALFRNNMAQDNSVLDHKMTFFPT